MKGVISHWLPVQKSLDSNEQRNHCKIPFPREKKAENRHQHIWGFSAGHTNTFPINPNSRKGKNVCLL